MSLFVDKRLIEDVFPDRKNQIIREIFASLKVNRVDEITNQSIIKILTARGFGEKKKIDFLNEITEFETSPDLVILFPEIISSNEILKEIFLKRPLKQAGIPNIPGIIDDYISDALMNSKYELTTTRRNKMVESFIDDVKDFESSTIDKENIAPLSLSKALKSINLPFRRYFSDFQDLKYKKIIDIIENYSDKLSKEQLFILKQIVFRTRFFNEKYIDQIILDDIRSKDKKYDHSIQILNARVNKNKTLQEIGDEFGVTRERIRQIEKKIRDRFRDSASQNFFIESLELTYFDISINAVAIEKLEKKSQQILKYINQEDKYNEELGIFGNLEVLDSKLIISSIQEYIENNPGKTLGEAEDFLNECLHKQNIFLDDDSLTIVLDKILKNSNKIILNEGFLYSKFTKKQMLMIVLQKYLKTHKYFEISLDNLKKLNEISQKIYFSDIYEASEDNYRPFESTLLRLSDDEELIRIDRKKYKIYYPDNYSINLLNNIKLFLEEKLKSAPEVSYKSVADNFEEELKNNDITDFEIYYVLRNNFNDDFDFGRQNTMSIRLKNSIRQNTEEVLLEVVKKNGGTLSVAEAQDLLGWDDYTVRQTISNSLEMFVVDSKIDCISNQDVKTISKIIKSEIDTTQNVLIIADEIKKLKKSKKYGNIINQQKLNIPVVLSYYLRNTGKYQGNNFILIKNDLVKDKAIDSITLLWFAFNEKFGSNIFTQEDMMNLLYYLGYKSASANLNAAKLVNYEEIIEISKKHFILKKYIPVTMKDVQFVEQRLDTVNANVLTPTEYLPKFKKSELFLNRFTYTKELICYMIFKGSKYRKLKWAEDLNSNEEFERHNTLDPHLLVKRESEILSINDYARKLLVDNKYSEREFMKKLKDYKVILSQRTKLPVELVNDFEIQLNGKLKKKKTKD